MTPKEKAKELVNKFYIILMKKNYPNVAQMDAAKECALIAVDEILDGFRKVLPASRNYWEQVKQEIEKL